MTGALLWMTERAADTLERFIAHVNIKSVFNLELNFQYVRRRIKGHFSACRTK